MEDAKTIEVLLAEDNPFDAEMTISALKKANMLKSMHWVKDGQEALDFLSCEGDYANRIGMDLPKLLLLDIKMPKIDGIEVLERVKGNEKLRTIPVVIMTSSDHQLDIAKAYRLGVNSYIVKPVQLGSFAQTVENIANYWLMTNRGR